jgi:hypothetical protein
MITATIKDKESGYPLLTFGKLVVGDLFLDENDHLCIKTEQVFDDDKGESKCNAVDLGIGLHYRYGGQSVVRKVLDLNLELDSSQIQIYDDN